MVLQQGLHRRDEDGRRQDARRDARRATSTRSRARASTSSRSTTTSPSATPSGWASSTASSACTTGVVVHSQGDHEKKDAYRPTSPTARTTSSASTTCATTCASARSSGSSAPLALRNRRRGRLDPHRRGAHAAHHQRTGRDVEPQVPHDQRVHPAPAQGRALHRRREEPLGDAHRRRRRRRAEADGDQEPLRPGQPRVAAHPQPVPPRAHALPARRELPRHRRRQGPHHRRVHRPRPPGAPLERRSAPGRRGQGRRAHPGRDAHDGDDHVPEPLPPLQEARPA